MCCACHGAARAAQPRGQPLLPRQGQIWENICSGKESASPGRGQAPAHQLLQRTENGLFQGGLPVPPPHPGHSKGQTLGLMAWKPTGGRRGGGFVMALAPNRRPSALSGRPQDDPITPQHLPCPLPVPRAPTDPSKGCPGLAPTCPSLPKAASAGLETCACSGKERGRENLGGGGVWRVHDTGPRALRLRITFPAPGSAMPHTAVVNPRLTGRSLALEEPVLPASVKVTGQGQPGGRGPRRTLPPVARFPAPHRLGSGPVPRAASRAVTCTHRQEQAPDP